MNIKDYRLLHYILIMLLMFAPVHSAMAMQQMHCNMDTHGQSDSMLSGMASHDMSAMMDHAGHHVAISDNADNNSTLSNQGNCCEGNKCAANCDMGMSASLLIRSSFYAPALLSATEVVLYSPELIVRAIPPPSRPPENLS